MVVTSHFTLSRRQVLTESPQTPISPLPSSPEKKSLPGLSRTWQKDTATLRQGKQWSSSLIWLSVVLFGGSLVWGLVGRIDQTVTVKGRLVPAGNVREVDIPSAGVVAEVFVQDGQTVQMGDPLIRIESVALTSKRSAVLFTQAILRAQQRYLSSLLSSPDIRELQFQEPSAGSVNLSPEMLQQLDVARRESEQIRARFKQIDLRQSSRRTTLALDQRIASDLEPLYREGGIGRINYLSQLNKVQESQAELATLAEERDKLIGEVAARLTQINRQLQDVDAELDGLNQALQYRTLSAPITGVVFDLKASSSSVVASDQVLLKIVPSKELQADVEVSNADIGFLKIGMPVDVSVDSFPSGEFGYINGKLTAIGADALPPDQQSRAYRFPATVTLEQQVVEIGNNPLNLQSGMSVTANIRVRSRPVISLITDLFTRQIEGIKRFR